MPGTKMPYRTIDEIVLAHPKLFRGKLPRTISDPPMGWGWIVHSLCKQFEDALSDEELETVHVRQIKEKFGTLRFHFDGRQLPPQKLARLRELVGEACDLSSRCCNQCGAAGKLVLIRTGCLRTLCDGCESCLNGTFQLP